MALSNYQFAKSSRSFKLTAAELNNQVVVVPPGVTLSKAATTHNPTGLPTPNPPPSAVEAGSAGSLSGIYLYAISYTDSTTGTTGAPSSTVEVTATSNKVSLVFTSLTNIASNSRVNAVDIWRTLGGGNVLFWAKRIAPGAGSWVDSLSDARISANDTLKVFNQAPRQLPQNTYAFALAHGRRIFVFGDPNYPGLNISNTGNIAARWPGVALSVAQPTVGTPAFSASRQRTLNAFTNSRGLRPGTTFYVGKGNQARWCESDNPDAWPTDNLADIGGPEPIRSAAALGNAVIVFKDNQVFQWMYRNDPDKNTGDGSIYDMEINRGAVSFKSVVNVDGSLFCLDQKGIYQYRGGQSAFELAEAIKPLFARINWRHAAQISGAYDDRRVYWSVPLDGETECRYLIVLDRLAFESGRGVRFWLWYVPMGVRDMATGFIGTDVDSTSFGMAGKRIACIITAAGYEFFIADVYRDGVHPELTAVGVTSTVASTVFGGGTFLSGNNDVLGCPVWFRHDKFKGTYIVQSCAATNFVIAGGSLGSTVPAGTSFVIGGIASWWKSRYFAAESPHNKKTGYGLDIEYFPTGKSAQFNAWVTGDRLANVVNSSSSDHTGWATRKHDETILVDTGGALSSHGRTGFVEIPAHVYDYGQMQIGAGHSGVDTPFFVTGFAVSERSKKVNR